MVIIEELKNGICKLNVTVQKENIPLDKDLIESGILDSYRFIQFVAFIEETFDIEILDEEINNTNFADLNTITALIETKRQG